MGYKEQCALENKIREVKGLANYAEQNQFYECGKNLRRKVGDLIVLLSKEDPEKEKCYFPAIADQYKLAGDPRAQQYIDALSPYQKREMQKRAYMGAIFAAAFSPDEDFKRMAMRDAQKIILELRSGEDSNGRGY